MATANGCLVAKELFCSSSSLIFPSHLVHKSVSLFMEGRSIQAKGKKGLWYIIYVSTYLPIISLFV